MSVDLQPLASPILPSGYMGNLLVTGDVVFSRALFSQDWNLSGGRRDQPVEEDTRGRERPSPQEDRERPMGAGDEGEYASGYRDGKRGKQDKRHAEIDPRMRTSGVAHARQGPFPCGFPKTLRLCADQATRRLPSWRAMTGRGSPRLRVRSNLSGIPARACFWGALHSLQW